MRPQFAKTWTPLIGQGAARALWKVAIVGIADAAVIAGATAIGGISRQTFAFYLGLGLACVLTVYLFFGLRVFVRSCSAFFGTRISILNLPPFHPDRFNSWREKEQHSRWRRDPA